MNDKRKFPRKRFETKAVLIVNDKEVSALILDITVEGVLLEVGQPLDAGENLELTLIGQGGINPSQLTGKVVRCEKNESDKYTVALELINPDDNYMMDVMAYIHRY